MRGKRAWTIGAAVAAIAVAGLATAQAARERSNEPIAEALTDGLNPGANIEQYLARIVAPLRTIDRDGDGLDRDDVAFQDTRRDTLERAQNIQQVLIHDHDGDFRVTRAEVALGARGEGDRRNAEIDALLKLYDADGDGVVTLQEAANRARGRRRDGSAEALLSLDPNGDGKLTVSELLARARDAFGRIDANGDGTLSREEYGAVSDWMDEIRMARQAESCDLPPVRKEAELVAFGAYGAEAVSSAVIGGQDSETKLIDVAIEPGTRPLYLILTSPGSMIWRFSGATGRVDRAVISSTKPAPGGTAAAGAVGLPAAKIHISRAGCPGDLSKADENAAKRSLASIRASLQRSPDTVFATYSPQGVALPSGVLTSSRDKTAPLLTGFDAATWTDAVGYWPAGVATVDPAQVVSKSKVEKYLVLPNQMGLSQLVGSGALTKESRGVFRVHRPIAHMPPSMGGAHSVTLIFSKGVPVAPGDIGHSCIVDESKGESRETKCVGRR